jgi:TonB family protein
MRIIHLKFGAGVVMIVALLSSPVIAQQADQKNESQECSFAVYSGKQVDQKVRILAKPEPEYDKKELRKSAPGAIILRAIFCGSGEVTDIKLQRGLSDKLDEKAVEAARKIQFIPAEKDGQKVSQVLIVEYYVNSRPIPGKRP